MENSLDAGATRIEISVTGGGKHSIRVTDNGCGIAPDEVELAFSRFATSKLSSLEDLEAIISLGFRGEALPSIAAVSRVTLTTRRKEDFAGTRIRVEGGAIFPPEAVGAPEGTEVLVEDLFYNTPGRMKFLRGEPQELARISALLTSLALAHPGCSFTLASEGKTVLRTTGDGFLLHAIGALYGSEAAAAMLPLQGRQPSLGLAVEGYISAPHFSRASRRWITVVVNGRVIQSPLLAGALERAYGGMLARRRHPVAVLIVKAPPKLLDVNVHPAKSEIRFQRPEIFNELVFRAARRALLGRPGAGGPPHGWMEEQQREWRRQQLQLLDPGRGKESREAAPAPAASFTAAAFSSAPEASPGDAAGGCRLIGQFLHSYLLAQEGEELLVIDQHAAHERVLYHALRAGECGLRPAQLTLPLNLELPPAWSVRLESLLPLLEEAGFILEPFGDNSYILRAIPSLMREGGAAEIYAFLEDLLQEEPEPGEAMEERLWQKIACHGAIKARQPLSRDEAEQLLRDWANTPGGACCPHGRPAVIRIHRAELDKKFLRKGGGRQ